MAYQDSATHVGSLARHALIDRQTAPVRGQSDAYAKSISIPSSAVIVTLVQGIPPWAVIYRQHSGVL
ncbi:hypothetical protein GCM10011408_37930 [Dyella caseinilytica]|nr:hypothetical protein GCM10011408_37930 [Dyella caseinilytica]